ncbi:MaoC family dehydratase [Pseudochelatococcus lubricantis]|uniref:MaoC family dehydratase n=1 Tax=Pseudochelatococcus lubricantis TaxID=1538102 RepID=UPI0035EEB6C1
MAVTGRNNYFESFSVGQVYDHARGRTVTNWDNYAMCHMSMNTASAHFDLVASTTAMDGRFRERLVLGPCTLTIVIGLTTEDMSENAFMDIAVTGIRLKGPVFQGDTLYARSEVLALSDASRPDAGLMRYRFTGSNQDGIEVATGERTVMIKRAAFWAEKDMNFGKITA